MNDDIRCPSRTQKLFAQLAPGVAVEVSCPDCRRDLRRGNNTVVSHVLHRYSVVTGELIDTMWVWPSGHRSAPIGGLL